MTGAIRRVMLDLETMSTSPDAAIVAIGAVPFNEVSGTLGPGFYARIDLSSAVRHGGHLCPQTVLWWLDQSDAARDELRRTDGRLSMCSALGEFAAWMLTIDDDPMRNVEVWGNGAAFDNVILRRAYERAGLVPPWSHWRDRCYRTLRDLPGLRKTHPMHDRTGTHHHALDDAISQARHAIELLNATTGASHGR